MKIKEQVLKEFDYDEDEEIAPKVIDLTIRKTKEQILKEIEKCQKLRVCKDCGTIYEVDEKGKCLTCESPEFEFAILKGELKKRLK